MVKEDVIACLQVLQSLFATEAGATEIPDHLVRLQNVLPGDVFSIYLHGAKIREIDQLGIFWGYSPIPVKDLVDGKFQHLGIWKVRN